MSDLFFEVRIALRALSHRAALSIATVLTLAIGVGATSALLALFHAMAIAPLRLVPDVDRVFNVSARYGPQSTGGGIYPADFIAWRDAATSASPGTMSIEAIGAYLPLGSVAWHRESTPRQLRRFAVSDGYFEAWGVAPRIGRTLEPNDVRPGAPAVVILTDQLWQRELGGRADVLGHSLILDGTPHEVIGVMPPGFVVRGGEPDVFMPLDLANAAHDRTNGHLGAIGRLRMGSSLATAATQLEHAADQLAAAGVYGSRTPAQPLLRPITEVMRGRRDVFALLGPAVALLLALVVLNCTQLQQSVAHSRAGEMAIRACLGARRGRLARHVLVETMVLAAIATPAGIGLAALLLRVLPDLGGRLTYRALPPQLGVWTLTATAVVIVLVALLASVLPTVRALQAPSLHRGSSARALSSWGIRSERVLVVVQVAAAFVLLTGAALLVRGTERLLQRDLGYPSDSLLQAEITLPASRYATASAVADFYSRFLELLRSRGGIDAAAAAMYPPGGGWGFRPAVDGDDTVPADARASARFVAITPGYEQTVGLSVLAGRKLSARDAATHPPVAWVSKTAATRLFGGPDAVGHTLRLEGRWHEVVGVVSDVRSDPLTPPEAIVYVPHAQFSAALTEADLRTMVILVRGAASPATLTPLLRAALHEIDPLLPLAHASTLDAQVARSLLAPRLARYLLTTFGLLGLLLAILGLYGLLRFHVRQRHREIGIRMAVGARPRDVQAGVLVQGLRLVLYGLASGLVLAFAAGGLLAHWLWGIAPHDPFLWGLVAVLLILASLLAAWLPARRATRIDPAIALRSD